MNTSRGSRSLARWAVLAVLACTAISASQIGVGHASASNAAKLPRCTSEGFASAGGALAQHELAEAKDDAAKVTAVLHVLAAMDSADCGPTSMMGAEYKDYLDELKKLGGHR